MPQAGVTGDKVTMHIFKESAMKWIISALLSCLAGFVWSQTNLQVEFRWLMSNHCNNTSPALKLKNIPTRHHWLAHSDD
ncbi:MAG: hypothetical protein EXR37_06415 [Limnohabitans sp.]|nr:hypothetical protein [Limnohabitans sp.]